MNFLLEICLLSCIIYLLYKTYYLKKQSLNAESLKEKNIFLEDQLTNLKSEFNSRESSLNKNLENLQSSFNKEQVFLQERKLELNEKEKKFSWKEHNKWLDSFRGKIVSSDGRY